MRNDTRLVLSDVRGPLTDLISKLAGENGYARLRALNRFLRRDLDEVGIYFSDHVCPDDILSKVTLTRDGRLTEFMVFSVKELGFPKGATYSDICRAGGTFGLEKCSPEAAVFYLLRHGSKLRDSKLIVAMEPNDRNGQLLFCIERIDNDLLFGSTFGGGLDDFWSPDTRFLFIRG